MKNQNAISQRVNLIDMGLRENETFRIENENIRAICRARGDIYIPEYKGKREIPVPPPKEE